MQQSCPLFFDIGDQAETCAQLFYVEEKICKLENNLLEKRYVNDSYE